MPLGSISTVNTQLGNLQRGVENIGSPLALLEQRRQQRVAEAQKQKDLEIKEKEAKIKAQNAQTLAATEARTAGKESDIAKEMARINKLYAPTAPSGTSAYLQQKLQYAQAMQASTNPDVIEYGNTILGKMDQERLGAVVEGQTMGELQNQAGLEKKRAEAQMNQAQAAYYQQFPYKQAPQLTKADVAEVTAALESVPENQVSWYNPMTWWNGLSDEEKVLTAGEAKALQEAYRGRGTPISIGEATRRVQAGEKASQMAPQAPQMGMPPQPPGAPPMPQQPQGQPQVREITLSR